MVTIILSVVIVLLALWLCLLTFFFWSLSAHYNNLVRATGKKTLQAALDALIQELDLAKKDIVSLKETCATIAKDGSLHIQKIGLLRFNPFKDTGGDQSFILALVDGHENGVVISGLYSRAGTRWYAKRVHNGVGVEHTLSEEEKKALKEAKQIDK